MRAFLKNNRQAPRKVRVIARAMVKKQVPVALAELTHMPQKGALTLKKLIASAVANAKQADVNTREQDLYVKNITVNKGMTFSRYMPRAFGRASVIHRESSHIHVELASVATQDSKKELEKKEKVEKKGDKKEKGEKKAQKTKTKKDTK